MLKNALFFFFQYFAYLERPRDVNNILPALNSSRTPMYKHCLGKKVCFSTPFLDSVCCNDGTLIVSLVRKKRIITINTTVNRPDCQSPHNLSTRADDLFCAVVLPVAAAVAVPLHHGVFCEGPWSNLA